MANLSPTTSKQALRHHFRQARRALSAEQQSQAATELLVKLRESGILDDPQNVAVYLSRDGEISCDALIKWCWNNNIRTYLPVLDPLKPGYLLFLPYTANTELVENLYKIPEPRIEQGTAIDIAQLSLMVLPLVAFDLTGNRLGMGGGFYDRTLSSKPVLARQNSATYPMLCGVAHNCQQTQRIDAETWDVPLDKIITPANVISITR